MMILDLSDLTEQEASDLLDQAQVSTEVAILDGEVEL